MGATTTNQDDRVELIQKLLAKAEDPAATEEESTAFFGKAQELMTKWAIDDDVLRAKDLLAQDQLETRWFKWEGSSRDTTWDADASLMSAIGRVHHVRMLVSKRSRHMVLIGFATDINNVTTLFLSLVVQSAKFDREAYAALGSYEKSWMGQYDKRVWHRSFREGFATRVGNRLMEIHRNATQEKKSADPGVALVLVDKKARVDAYYDGVEKGKSRSRGSATNYDARHQGSKAGDRANLGQKSVGGRAALGGGR